MAAGLGFKTFTTGEVLTAADVNGYLMQGILVFANAAARSSAITSPQEGQYSFLKDTNALEYYDGAAWVGAPVGDITAVNAGTGITGGGASGSVTITNDMATTITAAGDLVVGTGNATYDNLPIGTTGQVLTADTTVSPYKVKWAAAGSGSTVKVNYANPSADFTSSSSSTVDITGYSITFTPTSATNKILISYNLTGVRSTTDSIRIIVDIGGTTESLRGFYTNGSFENSWQGFFVMTNMAASSTTIKLRVNPNGTSTTFYGSAAGFKGQNLTVTEIY